MKIPVIGNGDVTDAAGCLKAYAETGCDLVMVGRGSYGNPFIFREIASALNGENYSPPTVAEKMKVMLEHIRLMISLSSKSEELSMHEARKHAAATLRSLQKNLSISSGQEEFYRTQQSAQ